MDNAAQRFEEARSFLNELSAHPPQVPYEPKLLPLLFAAVRDGSTSSLDDIAALIERSQNLAARILNIANSAYYVLEFKVSSLARALGILGMREVRSMVLMVGMVSAIKGVKLPENFDRHSLWMHHLRTAALARALALTLPLSCLQDNRADNLQTAKMDPDEAYVAGLLHDLGKVFLAASRPEVWSTVCTLQQQEGCRFEEAEIAYWGMDHGIVAARVLHAWKVPLVLTDAINWHHAPHLAPQGRFEASLLAAANMLDNKDYQPGDPIAPDILKLLPEGIDAQALADGMAEYMENDRSETLAGML